MKPLLWLALMAIALGGCTWNVYDIELKPEGNSLKRKLTVTRKNSSPSDGPSEFNDEVRRIALAYEVPPPAPGSPHVFERAFAGRMPADVGGYGTFTRWDTPFGSTAVYNERFRGNDDAVAQLKRQQAIADRVVDLLTAWLAGELKGDPQWPPLERFLQHDFRHDMHNLAIYAWTVRLTEKPEETFARGLQYIAERGYVAPDQIPAIRRAFADAERGDYERLMAWCTSLITARVPGHAIPLKKNLATPEGVVRSLTAFLETTDEYRKLLDAWQENRKTNSALEKPTGMKVPADLLMQLFLGSIQLGGDEVTVALKTDSAPLHTNGRWSAKTAKVEWPQRGLSSDRLPPILYAVWDAPNEPRQQKHFGSIALQGQSLLNYCIWYHGLTAEERKEWDAFIEALHPGPDLDKALNDFHFRHEPASGDLNKRLAGAAVKSILEGLKK